MPAKGIIIQRVICGNREELLKEAMLIERLFNDMGEVLTRVRSLDFNELDITFINFKSSAEEAHVNGNDRVVILAYPAVEGHCDYRS
jgi:hypothetical protein